MNKNQLCVYQTKQSFLVAQDWLETMICSKTMMNDLSILILSKDLSMMVRPDQISHLIDWNKDELDEKAQESNSQKSNGCQARYFQEFLLIWFLASLH
jgi:hypothetical protein